MRWKLLAVVTMIGGCGLLACSCRTLSRDVVVKTYPSFELKPGTLLADGQFQVSSVNSSVGADPLQVQVAVESLKHVPFEFRYRFRWRNENGREIQRRTVLWMPANIGPREPVVLQGVATDVEVRDFLLDIEYEQPKYVW